jgi:CIC family chloride channel protein
VIATGVGAGLAAIALMGLLRLVQHVAWTYNHGEFLPAVTRTSPAHRVVVLLAAGALAAAGILLVRKVFPRTRSLTAAIWNHSGDLPVRAAFANAVFAMTLVALGASLGREGAPKEASAAIGHLLSDRLHLTVAQRQLLVACAAGAGLAAVYNVPLGGALFAAEVLLGSLTLTTLLPAIAMSVIATAVSWLGLPNQPTYVMPTFHSSGSLLIFGAVAGPVAGILSVAYVRVVALARSTGHSLKGARTAAAAFAVFALLGVAAIAFPQLLGNGKDVVQLTFSGPMAVTLVGALLPLRVLSTAACLGTGAPGGLFTPTLTVGALYGLLLGALWNHFSPGNPAGAYALVGMSAFLAAATLGPLSSAVLLMELTYHAEPLLVASMLGIAGATLVSRLVHGQSIYAAGGR